jgi:hypothetical protein
VCFSYELAKFLLLSTNYEQGRTRKVSYRISNTRTKKAASQLSCMNTTHKQTRRNSWAEKCFRADWWLRAALERPSCYSTGPESWSSVLALRKYGGFRLNCGLWMAQSACFLAKNVGGYILKSLVFRMSRMIRGTWPKSWTSYWGGGKQNRVYPQPDMCSPTAPRYRVSLPVVACHLP